MLRPLQPADAHDLVALLEWMDAEPQREVFAPEARDPEDLQWECKDKHAWVLLDALGTVCGYTAVANYKDGLLLEGPLGEAHLEDMLRNALSHTPQRPIYAFAARDNDAVRQALEHIGFGAVHSTLFYQLTRQQAPQPHRPIPNALRLSQAPNIHFADYLELYRTAEEGWSERLSWQESDFQQHFANTDTQLFMLHQQQHALGFVELEYDGEHASIAYLAVHPAHRGQHHGRLLLEHAIQAAFQRPEIEHIGVRAHEHEQVACKLYDKLGFSWQRAVVSYLLEEPEDLDS